MRLLLWLSGEHPDLPAREVTRLFEGLGIAFRVVATEPRFLVLDVDAARTDILRAVERLGLTHEASESLFESSYEAAEMETAAQASPLAKEVSFAVRAERLSDDAPLRATEVERTIGGFLAEGRKVDLKHPRSVVRVFLGTKRLWAGLRVWDRDPAETAARHVHQRPVFSPVSLPPKLARALVNMVSAKPGDLVYDPFCGTGGVLLEAAAMGMQAVGSDIDPAMVDASRKNLAHFGLGAKALFPSDIADAPKRLEEQGIGPADAIVADLPYGRSASTGKEQAERLYSRTFPVLKTMLKPGRFAVLGLPREAAVHEAAQHLPLVEMHKVRVHRSLTRHFALFRAPMAAP